MVSNWTIQTNAKNTKNAEVLFNRFARQLQGEVIRREYFANGAAGCKVQWTMEHSVDNWSELLLDVLSKAQNVGNGWQLSGDVNFHCSAWCNRPRVAGVQIIEWVISRTAQAI